MRISALIKILKKLINALLLVGLIIGFLYLGKWILIPLILAGFIAFGISVFQDYLKQFYLFKRLPNWVQQILVIVAIFCLLFLIFNLITQYIQDFYINLELYIQNIEKQLNSLGQVIKFTDDIISFLSGIIGFFSNINLVVIFQNFISISTNMAGYLLMVFFYVLFLLSEKKYFHQKIMLSLTNSRQLLATQNIIKEIIYSIKQYFVLKTLISLTTSTIAYIIMLFFQLDFAFLWAFLIFLLNFIPNVGSMIATLFPFVFSIVQFSGIQTALWILLAMTTLQVVMGNVVEPKMLGASLNLSPLVVIVSLIFWGSIWGILGMFLAVPIMVVVLIILSNIQKTRHLAVWLSVNGKLNT